MGRKNRKPATKALKKPAAVKKTRRVVTKPVVPKTTSRFDCHVFLDQILTGRKTSVKQLVWASCCDGSSMPSYVLKQLGVKNRQLFGALAN